VPAVREVLGVAAVWHDSTADLAAQRFVLWASRLLEAQEGDAAALYAASLNEATAPWQTGESSDAGSAAAAGNGISAAARTGGGLAAEAGDTHGGGSNGSGPGQRGRKARQLPLSVLVHCEADGPAVELLASRRLLQVHRRMLLIESQVQGRPFWALVAMRTREMLTCDGSAKLKAGLNAVKRMLHSELRTQASSRSGVATCRAGPHKAPANARDPRRHRDTSVLNVRAGAPRLPARGAAGGAACGGARGHLCRRRRPRPIAVSGEGRAVGLCCKRGGQLSLSQCLMRIPGHRRAAPEAGTCTQPSRSNSTQLRFNATRHVWLSAHLLRFDNGQHNPPCRRRRCWRRPGRRWGHAASCASAPTAPRYMISPAYAACLASIHVATSMDRCVRVSSANLVG
jgi:hypothetical protein